MRPGRRAQPGRLARLRSPARPRRAEACAAAARAPRRPRGRWPTSGVRPVGARLASGSGSGSNSGAGSGSGASADRGVDHRDRAQRRCRAHVERGIPGDRPQVDGADDHVAALVESREGEEVLDEHAHAHRLLLDAVHRLRDIVLARDRAHPVELGVSAHRDERGAQLVARVADEAAHLPHGRVALRERGIHPAEHRVDRGLEAADLGRRRLDVGHALAEVARRDRHRGRFDLAEAAEGQGDQPPGQEGARDEDDHRQQAVDADVLRDDLVRRRQGQRDELRVEDAGARDLLQGDGRPELVLAVCGVEREGLELLGLGDVRAGCSPGRRAQVRRDRPPWRAAAPSVDRRWRRSSRSARHSSTAVICS